jgi:hypothetical protein
MKSKKILLKDVILTQEEKEQIAAELERESFKKELSLKMEKTARFFQKELHGFSFEDRKKILCLLIEYMNEESSSKIDEAKLDISMIENFIKLVDSQKLSNPFK